MTPLDPDIVARRLLSLTETLAQLDRPEAREPERLRTDPVMRAAVERWLQVAIEACVDLAYHVAAAEGWTPPETARDAFENLVAHGRLPPELGDRLGRAVGLRNLLVHEYARVEPARLAAVVSHDLADLEAFLAVARTWSA